MPDAVTLLPLVLVTLGAAVVQGAAGFAFALIATPAYMWILGPSRAVPLVITINLTICALLAIKIRRSADSVLFGRFLLGAAMGIPCGLLVFTRAQNDHLLFGVAIVILGFVTYVGLRRPTVSEEGAVVESRALSAGSIGMLAGATAMALGMPGPPVILYMTGIAVPKDTLRATALAFFTVSLALALSLQVVTVGVSLDVWTSAALLLPVAAGGGLLGNRLSRYVSEVLFRRCVLLLLSLIGISTLVGVFTR